MDDFLSIGIIGILLSVVMEWISVKFGVGSTKAKALVIVLSIVVGSVYVFFKDTMWWTTILGVLASASTVYALAFKK